MASATGHTGSRLRRRGRRRCRFGLSFAGYCLEMAYPDPAPFGACSLVIAYGEMEFLLQLFGRGALGNDCIAGVHDFTVEFTSSVPKLNGHKLSFVSHHGSTTACMKNLPKASTNRFLAGLSGCGLRMGAPTPFISTSFVNPRALQCLFRRPAAWARCHPNRFPIGLASHKLLRVFSNASLFGP